MKFTAAFVALALSAASVAIGSPVELARREAPAGPADDVVLIRRGWGDSNPSYSNYYKQQGSYRQSESDSESRSNNRYSSADGPYGVSRSSHSDAEGKSHSKKSGSDWGRYGYENHNGDQNNSGYGSYNDKFQNQEDSSYATSQDRSSSSYNSPWKKRELVERSYYSDDWNNGNQWNYYHHNQGSQSYRKSNSGNNGYSQSYNTQFCAEWDEECQNNFGYRSGSNSYTNNVAENSSYESTQEGSGYNDNVYPGGGEYDENCEDDD